MNCIQDKGIKMISKKTTKDCNKTAQLYLPYDICILNKYLKDTLSITELQLVSSIKRI